MPEASPTSLGHDYHRSEPHGGTNEEFRGLGHSPLDSPESHRHTGGTQDYEGEPEHLGNRLRSGWWARRKAMANWTVTLCPSGQQLWMRDLLGYQCYNLTVPV